jgi:hypothetical protein
MDPAYRDLLYAADMAHRRRSTLRLALDVLALTLVSLFFVSMLTSMVVADRWPVRAYLTGLTLVGLCLVVRGLRNLRRTLAEHGETGPQAPA